ncbi:MAG TPA: GH25 family lysozyme [Labilithrix sp.]|jgi:lysozyme
MRTGTIGIAALGFVLSACAVQSTSSSSECTDSTSAELRKCAGAHTLHGLDVSAYQGTVNWSKVKASGRTFAFARVSDGLTHHDAQFARNWRLIKQRGLVRGAYQFFRPSEGPIAQADAMLRAIHNAGGLHPGDLPPVLDLEVTDGEPHHVVVARAKEWLAHVHAKIGRKPVVYTAAFMSGVIGSSLDAYPLWVANFGATCPTMPSGWSSWHFFQNHDDGHVTGVAGAVDTDVFDGTHANLLAMTLPKPTHKAEETIDALPDHFEADDDAEETGAMVNDGSLGATLGSQPAAVPPPDATDPPPCAP